MGMVDALGTKGRLAYPKKHFLQIVKETLYRCNRNGQGFLWIEVPFKISDRNNLSLHSLLSEEHIGILGQGDGCLWCLYRNKGLQFLEDIKAKIISDIKEIEFMRDIGLESSTLSFDSKVYFYSGRSQAHFHEEDRFIKNWNNENDFFKIKRISIEHINEKTFKGTYVGFIKRLIDSFQ